MRVATWKCQDTLGANRQKAGDYTWALPASIKYRGWVINQWKGFFTVCKKELQKRTIPIINDWITAIKWVQRIYPNTYDFMHDISDREGGWGAWVWYGGSHWHGYHIGDDFLGADTVGGWMQFRYSTFAPHWRDAQANLKQRGYIIPSIPMPPQGGPSQYAAWLSPLGQALTAGYMKWSNQEGCHWCL